MIAWRDCIVHIEDPGSKFSPIIVWVPETRSGVLIQTAGSLWTPVITTGSLLQPPQEELEEEMLQWSQTSALEFWEVACCALPGRLIYWTPWPFGLRGKRYPSSSSLPTPTHIRARDARSWDSLAPSHSWAAAGRAAPLLVSSDFWVSPKQLIAGVILNRRQTSISTHEEYPNRIRMLPRTDKLKEAAPKCRCLWQTSYPPVQP